MSDARLGQAPPEGAQRDAIHVAIAPMIAEKKLHPGQLFAIDGKDVGIVDPFLNEPVMKGERFWLVLIPGSITSLRHDWSHPAFPQAMPDEVRQYQLQDSRQWMQELADFKGCTVDDLIQIAENGYDGVTGASWEVPPLFWQHYERLTGKRGSGETFFSCSC